MVIKKYIYTIILFLLITLCLISQFIGIGFAFDKTNRSEYFFLRIAVIFYFLTFLFSIIFIVIETFSKKKNYFLFSYYFIVILCWIISMYFLWDNFVIWPR